MVQFVNSSELVISAVAFLESLRAVGAPDDELDAALRSGLVHAGRARDPHALASVLPVSLTGHVLLAKSRRHDSWGPTGGHVERQDPGLGAAAAREVAEELAMTVSQGELEPLMFFAYPSACNGGHGHLDFCFLWVMDEPMPVKPSSDVIDAAWFPLPGPEPMAPHAQMMITETQRRKDSGRLRHQPLH